MTIDYSAVKTILEQLSKVGSIEVQMIFYRMLQDKKVDFNTLSKAYVEYLEEENNDKFNKLHEAELCVTEHLIDIKHSKGRKSKEDKEQRDKHIQRSLYLLNKSNRFNMSSLNEHFNYNENEAKKLSWYEREKNMKW